MQKLTFVRDCIVLTYLFKKVNVNSSDEFGSFPVDMMIISQACLPIVDLGSLGYISRSSRYVLFIACSIFCDDFISYNTLPWSPLVSQSVF